MDEFAVRSMDFHTVRVGIGAILSGAGFQA